VAAHLDKRHELVGAWRDLVQHLGELVQRQLAHDRTRRATLAPTALACATPRQSRLGQFT
jgi:hypothetical protein